MVRREREGTTARLVRTDRKDQKERRAYVVSTETTVSQSPYPYAGHLSILASYCLLFVMTTCYVLVMLLLGAYGEDGFPGSKGMPGLAGTPGTPGQEGPSGRKGEQGTFFTRNSPQ